MRPCQHWVTHAVVCDGSAIHPDSRAAAARASDEAAQAPAVVAPVSPSSTQHEATYPAQYEVAGAARYDYGVTYPAQYEVTTAYPGQYEVISPPQYEAANPAQYTVSVSMVRVLGYYLGAYESTCRQQTHDACF